MPSGTSCVQCLSGGQVPVSPRVLSQWMDTKRGGWMEERKEKKGEKGKEEKKIKGREGRREGRRKGEQKEKGMNGWCGLP